MGIAAVNEIRARRWQKGSPLYGYCLDLTALKADTVRSEEKRVRRRERGSRIVPGADAAIGEGRYNPAMARKPPRPRGPQLELAGELCAAFVNTAGARPENRQQGVASFAELLTWSRQTGALSTAEAERLKREAAQRPGDAEAAFARAVRLRTLLARFFLATRADEPVPQSHLDGFNAFLPPLGLVPAEQGVAWGLTGDEDAFDRMLWSVLESAAEVLIAAEGRPRVRQCAAKDCQLFFVDLTPSGHRVWCEMKRCGNRAKNLRYSRRGGKSRRR